MLIEEERKAVAVESAYLLEEEERLEGTHTYLELECGPYERCEEAFLLQCEKQEIKNLRQLEIFNLMNPHYLWWGKRLFKERKLLQERIYELDEAHEELKRGFKGLEKDLKSQRKHYKRLHKVFFEVQEAHKHRSWFLECVEKGTCAAWGPEFDIEERLNKHRNYYENTVTKYENLKKMTLLDIIDQFPEGDYNVKQTWSFTFSWLSELAITRLIQVGIVAGVVMYFYPLLAYIFSWF